MAAVAAILDIVIMLLTILNLNVASMPPTKFRLKPTYLSGADEVWRDSRWPLWRPSWISERNGLSNSISLCRHKASHQVWAQSYLRFKSRCCLRIFKMVAISANLDTGTERFLAVLYLYFAPMPPIKFPLKPTYDLRVVGWSFSRWTPRRPSWISELNNYSSSKSSCDPSAT